MPYRQPTLLQPDAKALPRFWLMTDQRMGDWLLPAIKALPAGKGGVIFRHYGLSAVKRHALYRSIQSIARKRRLVLLVAGPPALARRWQADGWHGPFPNDSRNGKRLLHSMAVHNAAELQKAKCAQADVLFISPVFATRSHQGAKTIGLFGFARLAQQTKIPAIALGGTTEKQHRRLHGFGAHGYAAIDHWVEKAKKQRPR